MKTGLIKWALAGALQALVLLGGMVHAQAQTSVAGSPLFQSFTRANGDFELNNTSRIIVDAGETELVRILSANRGWLDKLRFATGLNIQITTGVSATDKDIVLTKATNDSDFTGLTNNASVNFVNGGTTKNIGHNVSGEGYKYKAGSGGVTLQYSQQQGGFRAFQSLTRLLLQSAEGHGAHRTLPYGEGIDYPIFEKRHAMLDLGRFFIPVDSLIAYMEKMSFHKANVLHLHLNDDLFLGNAASAHLSRNLRGVSNLKHGFFRLAEIPGMRDTLGDLRPLDGNFYTREDWDRLEAAAERYGVEIVPEFNAPGHSNAWLRATENFPPEKRLGRLSSEHLKLDTPADRTRAVNYMTAVLMAYRNWFKSDTVHLGVEETGNTRTNVTLYLKALVDNIKYHKDSNPNGYKRIMLWSEANDKHGFGDLEWVVWKGSVDANLVGTNQSPRFNSGERNNIKFYDMSLDNTYFVPVSSVGAVRARWVKPDTLFKAYFGSFNRAGEYNNIIPDGVALAFWGDKLLQIAPWIGRDYVMAAMNDGMLANAALGWHANRVPNTGGASKLTQYSQVGYDRLIPASQEYHSHLVRERFPYLSAEQVSVIMYTTTSHSSFYRGNAIFSQDDDAVAAMVEQSSRERRGLFSGSFGVHELRPVGRDKDWMWWDEWELIKMFGGPNQFGSGMFGAQLVGAGNELSAGVVCTDIRLVEQAIDDYGKRAVSACDEDHWINDISGTGGLRKSGPGTLGLHGENSFQGGIMLAAGKLAIGSGKSLGDPASVLTFAGGTLVMSPSYEKLDRGRAVRSGRYFWRGEWGRYHGDFYDGHDYSQYFLITVSTPQITIEANRRMVLSSAGEIEVNNEKTEIKGVISGAGMLTKSGTGKLLLGGTNTFTGGLMVEEGALEIAADGNLGTGPVSFAGGALSFAGDTSLPSSRGLVLSGDAAIDTNGHDATVMGVISGSGALTKAGAGVLSLLGSNTFTGDIQIASGAGTLEISPPADAEYAQNFIGEGLIRKAGSSVLTLKGSSAPDWEIAAGSVVNEGVFAGDIEFVGSGDRLFEFSGNHRYAGIISGDGKMAISDGGLLLLRDSRRFAGVFEVKADGTLLVDGRLGGNVNVASGGELGGQGRIGGNVMVASGGTLNPSRGTTGQLVIDGNLDLDGNYKVTFGLGALISGSADISGALMVLDTAPPLDANTPKRFNVLTAVGGVTGQFSGSDTSALPFLTLTITYDSDRVQMRAGRNAQDLASLLGQPEEEIDFPIDEPEEEEPEDSQESVQAPTADPADELPDLQPIQLNKDNTRVLAQLVDVAENTSSPGIKPLSDVIMTLQESSPDGRSIEERVEEILDSFVAKTHASAKAVFLASSAGLRSAAVGQTRAAFSSVGSQAAQQQRFSLGNQKWGLAGQPNASALWAKTMGSRGTHARGELQSEDMTFKGVGFLIGGDRAVVDNVRVGLFGGASKTDFDQERSAGEDDSKHVGIYAGLGRQQLGVRAGVTFTRHNININRTVAGTPLTLGAEYESQTYDIFAELGYQVEQGGTLFEPFAAINYSRHAAGEYTESNSDGTQMNTYPEQSTNMSILEVGMRFKTEVPVQTILHGMLAWHLPIEDPEIFTIQRIGNISQPVDIPGTPISGKGFVLEAGVADLTMGGEDATFDFTYRYSKSFYYRNSSEKHSLSGKFTYSF